tara:strand:+ start:562 stop:687 length:126 start_codon:yes stop_codon:yes gene_type:complete
MERLRHHAKSDIPLFSAERDSWKGVVKPQKATNRFFGKEHR